MPKYQELIYGTGVTYGQASRIAFNAEPLVATAISHSAIQLTWAKPQNTLEDSYVGFRIVRNQDAYPETEEDGAILYEFYSRDSEIVDRDSFIDGVTEPARTTATPLVSGRFAYYRAWILLDENGAWVRAGDTYTILPSDHSSTTGAATVATYFDEETGETVFDETIGSQVMQSTHERLMNYLPRVLTNTTNSAVDEIERTYDSSASGDVSGAIQNSLISQFLSGFSLTLDEIMNLAEFTNPELSGKNTDPTILSLQSQQYGLAPELYGVSKTQKRLVREALYMYRRKGTMAGLQTYVESATGYDASITVSPNLMLSSADSTFFESTGSWVAETGCSIAAQYKYTTPSAVTTAIDNTWCAAVTFSATTASVSLGTGSSNLLGIPVTAGSIYTLSFYVKKADGISGTNTVTPSVVWYDRKGKMIGVPAAASSASAIGDNWARVSVTKTAPAKAVYAGLILNLTRAVGTLNIPAILLDEMQFEKAGSATAFKEARGVTIFLNPKKTNYLSDPSFEGDLSSWTFDATSQSAVTLVSGGIYNGPIGARAGLKKLRLVSKSVGNSSILQTVAGLPRGKFYTLSLYAKSSATVSGNLSLSDLDATSTSVSNLAVTLTTEWKRFEITHFEPVVGSDATNSLRAKLDGNFAGATLEIDCVQLEPSYYATDYFDGSLTDAGAAWSGTANAASSVSYLYPNLNAKLVRLSQELPEFLPLNTPYEVDLYQNSGGMVPPSGIS
jgi:hypothetical protein